MSKTKSILNVKISYVTNIKLNGAKCIKNNIIAGLIISNFTY